MQRLTKGDVIITSKEINEFLTLTEDNPTRWHDIYYKIKHYEDLEESRHLIEFPCAVGDIVYFIDNSEVVEGKVVGLYKALYDDEDYITLSIIKKYSEELKDVYVSDYYNDFFTSYEDAEYELL